MKYIILVIVITSCQKTNSYYTDPNNSRIERITYSTENYNLGVSAIGHDNYLEILVSTELLKKEIILKNINLITIEPSDQPTKKELYFSDGKTVYFEDFSKLKDIDEFNNLNKKVIRFYFEDLNSKSRDNLNFDIIIESNVGVFKNHVVMKRHSRSRIPL